MSAKAYFNTENASLIVKAHIYIYGNEASDELALKIKEEINTFWNAPKAEFTIEGKPAKVIFDIQVSHKGLKWVAENMKENSDFEVNFVRIEKTNKSARSMMGYGLGENSGHWLITDQLGESTTASHEFGHALGLPHPEILDYRGTGIPPIMAPRGTLVDAMFQWNPLVEAGTTGGTMKPIYRRVRPDEVWDVLKHLKFNDEGQAEIGKLTNYFFDTDGDITQYIV
jgi:hypothetical protein